MITWGKVLLAVMKFANLLADYMTRQGLMNEAQRLVLADQIIELSKKGEALDQVRARVAAMSDDDVDKRLHERGDFRD